MNISGIKNTSSTSFSSVNLVQISKKAFENPNDIVKVNDEFKKITHALTKKANSKWQKLLTSLGLYNNKKLFFLEQIGYVNIEKEFAKTKGIAHFWLSRNTGIPTVKPLDPDYHSFTILTKTEQKKVIKLFNPLKMIVLGIQIGMDYALNESCFRELIITARVNQIFTEKVNKITNGKPIHKFMAQNLSELPKILEKIDN